MLVSLNPMSSLDLAGHSVYLLTTGTSGRMDGGVNLRKTGLKQDGGLLLQEEAART